jgi:hypothetical protein
VCVTVFETVFVTDTVLLLLGETERELVTVAVSELELDIVGETE